MPANKMVKGCEQSRRALARWQSLHQFAPPHLEVINQRINKVCQVRTSVALWQSKRDKALSSTKEAARINRNECRQRSGATRRPFARGPLRQGSGQQPKRVL